MKSTKFWTTVIASLFFMSVAASLIVMQGTGRGSVANIYQNGVCIHSVDLSVATEGYMLEIGGQITNIIAVESGRIRVSEATCPDQVCVRQGWISNRVVPIVCMPNSLVIEIEEGPATELDAVAR